MKNGYQYKIDANIYESPTFPVAIYRRTKGWFARWVHVESYRSQQDAIAAYDSIPDETGDLPRLL